jgi:hypothetical protein
VARVGEYSLLLLVASALLVAAQDAQLAAAV